MKNKSTRLSYLLRHDKEYEFGVFGWREVSDLIENHGFMLEDLKEIVETNNKQRFEFSADRQYLRARQGHSINVDVELDESEPPIVLYHGTAKHFVKEILEEGLKPQKRLHVHLTHSIEMALAVGKRHGEPAIFQVDSMKMFNDGIKFYLSRNGVWLTNNVPTEYISLVKNHEI